ncbi:unnamed protein product [Vitrella brassicaformis CCMP3155]|uniref:RING-type domain-containing protein n=1 Tax=Vitrella brassicaformis (strain CCMP3155) TaxID=1169540 RepID=A0A0G4FNK4_VITBC|nr:unnamed protein product [Vitrella brassicaformis CCMP3155]|eukprot:CEM15147.1 unnamed protein product [Vitrella brassicaformis CCMP3155]
MTSLGNSRPSGFDAAIALLSSPEELPDDAFDSSLKVVGANATDAFLSGGPGGSWEALGKKLLNQRLLRRAYHAFTDGGNPARQGMAASVLWFLCQRKADARDSAWEVAGYLIPIAGSPRTFISMLASVLTQTTAFRLEMSAFTLLAGAMVLGRQEGNAVDTRDHLIKHCPAILDKALSMVAKIAEDHPCGRTALAFIRTVFDTVPIDGPPFPPTVMPVCVCVGVFRALVECLTSRKAETRDKMRAVGVHYVGTLLCSNIQYVAKSGSEDDRAAYLAAMRQDIFPFVDTFCGLLTSPDADDVVRDGATTCCVYIFDCCSVFAIYAKEIGTAYFATLPDGPVQRLMRAPKALQAYVTAVKSLATTLVSKITTTTLPLAVPQMLAVCGHRDAVYSSGCISMASDIAKRLDKESVDEVATVRRVFRTSSDATQTSPTCAPRSLCVTAFQERCVTYGDRVSSRGGKFRPNGVTRAILQHEAVKAMRAAAVRQPNGRRKGHQRQQQQQQQLTAPKELLDLFDEIESAAKEWADAQLLAEVAPLAPGSTTSSTKGGKKSKGGKRGGRGDNSTETTSSSSAAAIGTSEDRTDHQEEDAEDHHGPPGPPSPSPPSPPRPSCSYSSSAAGGTSVSVGGGRGQQQGAGGGGDDGGGFITVGRKKRGGKDTGGHTQQQQQTNTADKRDDNSGVFPSSSSSESTRPSSSNSSVCGGPHNAPAVPFPLPPRPAAPPPQPPSRHRPTPTPTPAPSSSRLGCGHTGLPPLAAGGSSSSSLQTAVEVEGRSGHDRCGGEVSELQLMRQQLEAMRLEKEAMQRTNEAILREKEDIKREKDRLEESTECDICMAEKKSIVLIPCRHFCLCGVCAAVLMSKPVAQRLCPRCRQAITATRHVYL